MEATRGKRGGGPYSTPSASSMVSNSSTAASGSWSSAFLGTPGYIPLMASVTSLTLYPILMASVAVQLTLQHSLCRSDRCPPPTGQSRHIPNCVHPTPPGQLAAAETPRSVHMTTRVCLFVWGELPKVGSKPSEVQGVDSPRLKHIVEFCLELRCTFHRVSRSLILRVCQGIQCNHSHSTSCHVPRCHVHLFSAAAAAAACENQSSPNGALGDSLTCFVLSLRADHELMYGSMYESMRLADADLLCVVSKSRV